MEAELIQLFEACKKPETVGEASVRLDELLNTSEVFESLFNIIKEPSTKQVTRKDATVYLTVAVRDQFILASEEINEELFSYVKSQIIELLFTIHNQEIIDILLGSVEKIIRSLPNGVDSWPDLFTTAVSSISQTQTINSSVSVIATCVPLLSDEVINESLEQFLQIVNAGIGYSSWPVRAASFEILQKISPFIIEAGGDVSSQVAAFLQYPETPQNLNDGYLFRIWVVISVLASKQFISEDQLQAIYELTITVVSQPAIGVYTRYLILLFVLNVLPMLNEEQLGQVLDLNFQFASQIVGEQGMVEPLLLQIIEAALTDLDLEAVYGMLKERIVASLESEDQNLHCFSVHVLATILLYGPEAARDDISFIDETLTVACESENTLLQQAACFALDCLDETFPAAQVLCSSFLMKVLPFLETSDPNLKTMAFSALHCICQLLDKEVDGFFHSCWELHEQLSNPTDFDSFASIFADAFSRADVSDEEMDDVLEYVSGYFSADEDIDDVAPVLLIVAAILNKDEAQAESLFDPSMEMCYRALCSSNDQTQINGIDFIQSIFSNFSAPIMEHYKFVIRKIRSMAKSITDADASVEPEEVPKDEEEEEEEQLEPVSEDEGVPEHLQQATEEEDDDEDDSRETVYCAAIQTMAAVIKQLHHKRYARELQECIITALSLDETITSMYDAATMIAKFLSRTDAKQLFLNLHDIIVDEKNPHTVSDALAPYTKLVKHTCQKNQELFVTKAYEVLQLFFEGELPCLGGVKPLEGRSDYVLMTNIAYLITEIVRIPNKEGVDQLCQCMLEILKVEGHLAAYSFLGAYSDAIKYETCSPECISALFEIVPDMIESAEEPDLQQNICFLLNILVQKNSDLLSDIVAFFPTIWGWYENGAEQESGFQGLLSNAASLFITLSVMEPSLPEEATIAAFAQYPPYDITETKPMTEMILKFFSQRSEFSGELLSQAIIAICNLLVMTESELSENKVTPEQFQAMKQLLKQLASSSAEVVQLIQSQFENYRTKLAKISAILEEN